MKGGGQRVVPCVDLDAAIAHHVDELGYRLDMIMPADAPRVAIVSKQETTLRLVAEEGRSQVPARQDPKDILVTRAAGNTWIAGRAGMRYRDLIPGRLGGRVIASHIRIEDGGPVADYVHYHKIDVQMIYCRRGWVRVVYEDQGPPFVMHPGDCVLQPPEIRHQVLESSAGLEVIEIASPAEHETWRDHALRLPTAELRPTRLFAGQRFVRHVAADAVWQPVADGVESRDTGIAQATSGYASARVLRFAANAVHGPHTPTGDLLFFAIIAGRLHLRGSSVGVQTLDDGDCCVIPTDTDCTIDAITPSEVLEVTLRVGNWPTAAHVTPA